MAHRASGKKAAHKEAHQEAAGKFLAPQWAVTNDAARAFADAFYNRLCPSQADSEPAPVSVAVQQARLAVHDDTGDPSWLAYALYAHPNARVEP